MVIEEYIEFRAMNTGIQARAWVPGSPGRERKLRQTLRERLRWVRLLFKNTEYKLSRFKEESELSRLNQNGRLRPCSGPLLDGVEQALKMAKLTDGIFDPTILKSLEAAGYDRSFELINQAPLTMSLGKTALVSGSWPDIKLDRSHRSIELPTGLTIDLGGIAKGMTVDRAARLLRDCRYENFMVSAGGDLFVSGYEPDQSDGWEVYVQNPLFLEEELAVMKVSGRAVATSSVTKRRWTLGNRTSNHLIDPRTGQPVQNNLAAVTVIAPTTTQADVMAKTVLILGPEEGREFIEKQPGCQVLMVFQDGTTYRSPDLPVTQEFKT